jgi:hypothetical protein
MQYGDAFFSSGAGLWMAVAAMFLVAGVVKGAIGLGLPTISTMLEKHRLAAVVLGTRLCSIVPAATYAQDKLERFQEQSRIIDGRLLAAVTATLKTTPATGVAVGEVREPILVQSRRSSGGVLRDDGQFPTAHRRSKE